MPLDGIRAVAASRRLALPTAASPCFSAIQPSVMSFMAVLLVEEVGIGLVAAGAILAAAQVAGVVGRVLWGVYALAGLAKGDREGTARRRGRNYALFGAPVGMIFTIDRDLGQGNWLDFGMFRQSIMIAARGHGLDTCPQAALANYPGVVRRQLGVPDGELVLCGLALGVVDPDEPTNRPVADRGPVRGFATFYKA